MNRAERWTQWTGCGPHQLDSLPRTETGGAKRPKYCPRRWTAFGADGVLWNPPCLPDELGVRAGGPSIRPDGPVMPGRYKSLYQYLENRYANRVVLTIAQIEDLLGFTAA